MSPFFPSKMEPAALLHLQDSFVSSLVSSYLWFQWGSRGCSQQGKGGPQTSPPALLTWGARRAVPHTFPHTFPSLPGSVLPFLKYISTEAPPALLMGSAVPGAGAAAEPAGTGPVQHGAALDSPQRARPTAPAASTWAWTPKTQGEGAGVQIEITPQGIVLPRCEQWTHFGVCAQVLPSKS